ncbi:MAG: VOC family protein [Pseudohongiellaceae bacterium]
MKYLHTMVRVSNIENSLDFYCNKLGLQEVNRYESEEGRFTLVFLSAPGNEDAQVELTYNWDPEDYDEGRNFGHLAYSVKNIYETCQQLMDGGVTINRPPRDGRMAFVRSPDNVSIELLQGPTTTIIRLSFRSSISLTSKRPCLTISRILPSSLYSSLI